MLQVHLLLEEKLPVRQLRNLTPLHNPVALIALKFVFGPHDLLKFLFVLVVLFHLLYPEGFLVFQRH